MKIDVEKVLKKCSESEEAYLLGKYSFYVDKEITFIAHLAKLKLNIKDFDQSPFFEVLTQKEVSEMYIYYVQRCYERWKDPIALVDAMLEEQIEKAKIIKVTQLPRELIENIAYARQYHKIEKYQESTGGFFFLSNNHKQKKFKEIKDTLSKELLEDYNKGYKAFEYIKLKNYYTYFSYHCAICNYSEEQLIPIQEKLIGYDEMLSNTRIHVKYGDELFSMLVRIWECLLEKDQDVEKWKAKMHDMVAIYMQSGV